MTVADRNAGRMLRRMRDNPPGRSGAWWERNRARLVAALEAARLQVCAYPTSATCDCKYGLVPGGFDPMVVGDEHTGCPELRDLIEALYEGGSSGRNASRTAAGVVLGEQGVAQPAERRGGGSDVTAG